MQPNPSHDGQIQVKKTLFWKSPREGCRVNAHIIGYTGTEDRRLVGLVREDDFDRVGKLVVGQASARLIHSDDHGQTWQEQEPLVTRETPEGITYDYPQTVFLDRRHNVCVFFSLRRWVKDPSVAAKDVKKYSRQLYRISRDGGRTWEDEQILIQKGPQYDQTNYLRGIRFGYNAGFISNEPLQCRDGTILIPFFLWPWDEQQKKANPKKKTSAVLIANWTEDLRQIEWDLGQYTKVTDASGCLCEITLAQRDDGSLLGIMRADPQGGPGKIYCLSGDGGQTWTDPQRLTFEGGEPLYSPSAISRLIRSARTGKLYWIGNILPFRKDHYVNVPSNRHRFILQIAEVNEEDCSIKRETVTIIDQSQNEADPKEYSNAYVYEDRDSGNLILTMCEACALPFNHDSAPPSYQGPFMSKPSFTSDSYRYEIRL